MDPSSIDTGSQYTLYVMTCNDVLCSYLQVKLHCKTLKGILLDLEQGSRESLYQVYGHHVCITNYAFQNIGSLFYFEFKTALTTSEPCRQN